MAGDIVGAVEAKTVGRMSENEETQRKHLSRRGEPGGGR